jgi:hypothetical protein
MRLGEGLGCWDQANLRSVLMRAGWDRGRGVWGRVCTPSLGFKTRFGLQARWGSGTMRRDARGLGGSPRGGIGSVGIGGQHRWAASPCATCNPIRRRTSEGDRRRQYMSSLSTGWSEAGLGVGRRQATRAAAVGFRGSIGWVVGAARSRWRPICRLCLAACARVWRGAQRRERVQNESGSGRAWARKAGEATVRPGAR